MPPARPRFKPRKPGDPSVGRRRGVAPATKVKSTVPSGVIADEDLAELIGSLTGKEVKVGRGPVLTPGPSVAVVASTYTDDDGAVGALLLADVAAAAGISAALTLMPVGSVVEAMRIGYLDEALLENWSEIANIATQIVRVPTFPAYKLAKTVQSETGLTPPVEALLATATYRVGWNVQVPQYANGRLTLVIHKPS